jgi:hypothetical protein
MHRKRIKETQRCRQLFSYLLHLELGRCALVREAKFEKFVGPVQFHGEESGDISKKNLHNPPPAMFFRREVV